MSAQAWAAWVGAALGVINLLIGLWSRRPIVGVFPASESLNEAQSLEVTLAAGTTPLVIKNVCVFPSRKGTVLTSPDLTNVQETRQALGHPFRLFVRPSETGRICFMRSNTSRAWLLLIWWSEGRFQPLPISVFVVTKRRMRILREAGGGS